VKNSRISVNFVEISKSQAIAIDVPSLSQEGHVLMQEIQSREQI